jgi:hypothetical protein
MCTLAFMASFSLPGLAATGTDTYNPSSDGWAQHGAAATHAEGANDPLVVGNSANERRTYLRFTLPSYAGKSITAARLVLYMSQPPTKQNGKVAGQNCPESAVCISSRTYQLYRTNDSIPDDNLWTGNIFNDVVPDVSLGSVSTGTVPADLTWNGAALFTEVNAAVGSDLTLIVADPQTGQDYEARFGSRENATEALRPRLVIDWEDVGVPPEDNCDGQAAGTLLITRWGQPDAVQVPWNTVATVGATIHFTIQACGADFTDIKAQGGMAANTTTVGWGTCYSPAEGPGCPLSTYDAGTVADSAIGNGKNNVKNQNNKVLTWRIPELAQGESATLTIHTLASVNNQGKAACGIKNLTGNWSVSGTWIHDGFGESASASVGQLVLDLLCPLP